MSIAALDPARVVASGHCPECARDGRAVLLAPGSDRCAWHSLETARSGQVRLSATGLHRRRYATGVQEQCVSCAAAGRAKLGLPRDGDGSDPLCLACWRGREDRRAARLRGRLVAELRERLDVDEPVGCAVCGAAAPTPECWLCGWSWLADVRAAYEAELATQAAVEAARFAAIAAVAEAERRVDELTGWVERLRAVLDGYPVGRSQGRAVELLADALARDAAARATRRGRPPTETRRVWAVLAVDADWRSGRRGMPGRSRTAELAGCAVRVVTAAWARAEAIGWATRTQQGRRLTLAERTTLGRARQRAEFDLAFLHRGHGDPVARAGWVPAALAILADLLDYALTLHRQAVEALDEARGRAGGWTEYPEMVRRAQLRRAVADSVARTRDRIHAADIDGNFRSPHTVSLGVSVYSCLSRGLVFSPPIMVPPAGGGRRTRRRQIGASRSSTKGRGDRRPAGPHSLQHPRTTQGSGDTSQPARRRPAWAEWAYELARAVRARWAWLRLAPLPRVAAALGSRLGPDWTAEALVRWIESVRRQPVLTHPHAPVAYLCAVLDEALASPIPPPHPAAAHTAHQREQAAAQAAQLRARQAAGRAAAADQARRAVPAHTNAAVQALRARWQAGHQAAAHLPLAQVEMPSPAIEHACQGGCGAYGTHVEIRTDPWSGRHRPLCPSCWDSIRRAN